jgi:hypothetical protein
MKWNKNLSLMIVLGMLGIVGCNLNQDQQKAQEILDAACANAVNIDACKNQDAAVSANQPTHFCVYYPKADKGRPNPQSHALANASLEIPTLAADAVNAATGDGLCKGYIYSPEAAAKAERDRIASASAEGGIAACSELRQALNCAVNTSYAFARKGGGANLKCRTNPQAGTAGQPPCVNDTGSSDANPPANAAAERNILKNGIDSCNEISFVGNCLPSGTHYPRKGGGSQITCRAKKNIVANEAPCEELSNEHELTPQQLSATTSCSAPELAYTCSKRTNSFKINNGNKDCVFDSAVTFSCREGTTVPPVQQILESLNNCSQVKNVDVCQPVAPAKGFIKTASIGKANPAKSQYETPCRHKSDSLSIALIRKLRQGQVKISNAEICENAQKIEPIYEEKTCRLASPAKSIEAAAELCALYTEANGNTEGRQRVANCRTDIQVKYPQGAVDLNNHPCGTEPSSKHCIPTGQSGLQVPETSDTGAVGTFCSTLKYPFLAEGWPGVGTPELQTGPNCGNTPIDARVKLVGATGFVDVPSDKLTLTDMCTL